MNTNSGTHMLGNKIACVIALGIVTADCALKALGAEPQSIFSEGNVWLWWFPAIWWFICTFNMLFLRVVK